MPQGELQCNNVTIGKMVILGGVFSDPGRTVQISKNGVEELSYLKFEQHEEADSSLLFVHINYFVTKHRYQRVIVQVTDTTNSNLSHLLQLCYPVWIENICDEHVFQSIWYLFNKSKNQVFKNVMMNCHDRLLLAECG